MSTCEWPGCQLPGCGVRINGRGLCEAHIDPAMAEAAQVVRQFVTAHREAMDGEVEA